jgi:uncharacterized protein (TIGR03067 family)
MSPEQARGEAVDARSDLFSLGSVLYAMCTGRPAFRADNPVAVLRRVCDDTPRPIREVNAEIPEWLETIVNKLLAKDPADRFQSADEVAELLSQHLAHVQNPALAPLPAPIRFANRPAHDNSRGAIAQKPGPRSPRQLIIEHPVLGALAISTLLISASLATYMLTAAVYRKFARATSTATDSSPAAFAKLQYARLQGTWAAINGEAGGQAIPGSDLINMRLVFDADHVTAMGAGAKVDGEGSFELETTASSRRIKITYQGARNRFAIGVYDLDGDRLKICIGDPAEDTVTEFKSRPGTSILLAEFVRLAAPPGTIVLPALPELKWDGSMSIYDWYAKNYMLQPQPVDAVTWGTFVNPRGDCRLKREANRITLTVPGGVPHNLLPGEPYNFDAPRLMNDVEGNFAAQVIVPPYPRPTAGSAFRGNVSYRSVGFVVWIDEKNLLRFERNGWGEQRAGAPFLHVEWYVDGQYRGDETEFLPDQPDRPTHLQLERRGSELHLQWSRDGETWNSWRIVRDMNLPPRISLGLAVQNSTNAQYSAVFERLAVAVAPPKSGR